MRGGALGRGLVICVALIWASSAARGATVTFNELTAFQAATGATAEAPLPNEGRVSSGSSTVGDLTYSIEPGGVLFVGTGGPVDFSARLAGNEIGLSGFEHLNVDTATPVYSLGFAFHEPQQDPNVNDTFVDSTFTVTLLNQTTPVGAFTFNAPNDAAAFVGVWSSLAFNRVEIRETIGGNENEFFGQFYTGTNALVPVGVPLPAAAWAGLVLLGGFGMSRERRRSGSAV